MNKFSNMQLKLKINARGSTKSPRLELTSIRNSSHSRNLSIDYKSELRASRRYENISPDLYDSGNIKLKPINQSITLLESKNEEIDDEFKLQLSAKDRRIEKLNSMILDLRVKIKENDTETIVKKLKQRTILLEEELELIKEERDNEEKNYEILEAKYKRACEKWEEEKDLFRYDKELSLQEISQLKISLQEKENIIDENKGSIAFISRMLTQTNQTNNELNQKMQSINEELDKVNKSYHESQKLSKLAEGYKKNLEIYIEDIADKEKKIERFNESVKALIEVANQIKNLEENIEQKIWNFKNLNSESSEAIKYLEIQIENVSDIYEKLNASIINYTEINAIGSDKSIRSQLTDLNANIKREILIKEKYHVKYDNSKQEIIRLTDSISNLKDLHKEEIYKLKTIIDSNVSLFEKLKNTNHEIKEKLLGKDLEIKMFENKIKIQKEKIDDFITQKEKFSLREEELKLQLEHFKSKMMKLMEERRSADLDLSIRENNLEKSLWKIDSLKDELMKRENEIVKKGQKLILLETEMQRLKTNINKYIYHDRNVEGHLLGNYLKDLATRDQKIEILKEMVRVGKPDDRLNDFQ